VIDISDIRKTLPKKEFKIVKILKSARDVCLEDKDAIVIRTKMELKAMRKIGVKFKVLNV